jgi:hypothetical protein
MNAMQQAVEALSKCTEWLYTERAIRHYGPNFMGEVEAALASLKSALQKQPEPVERLKALMDKLDGYLTSPEQIALRDELLASLHQQEVPSGWMPIETAPKDGTEILIWREDCGVLMGCYCSANELSTMSDKDRDELDEASLFQEDWWGGDADGGGYRLEGSEVPTHWMPMPAEPHGVALPATTEFAEAKRTIMEVLSEQDVRALAIAQFIQLKFHEKYGNAMENAYAAYRAEQATDGVGAASSTLADEIVTKLEAYAADWHKRMGDVRPLREAITFIKAHARGVQASAAPKFDVEEMLRECVPAGSFFGSLKVADAIRAYFAASGLKEVPRG